MFPCDGYLKLAQELAVRTDEACLRSAVSRAYYASLHNSIKFAESKGIRFSCKGTARIHTEIRDCFKNHSGIDFYAVGLKLGRLLNSRGDCDYKDNIKDIKKIAENAIMDAEEIFKLNVIS